MSDTCFGHLSSEDLVHWKRHPDTPFSGATGTVVRHDGEYYMFFTGPGQAVSLAVSQDLDHWTLVEGNPIVSSDGDVYQHGNFRDPYVFFNEQEDCWWMLLGDGALLHQVAAMKQASSISRSVRFGARSATGNTR
jgi:beta-fructofuranosidase